MVHFVLFMLGSKNLSVRLKFASKFDHFSVYTFDIESGAYVLVFMFLLFLFRLVAIASIAFSLLIQFAQPDLP